MSNDASKAIQCPIDEDFSNEPLPLFRPQALSRQERFYGEAVLIRPFSLAFLGWLAVGAATIASSVFFVETHTETVRVKGVLLGHPASDSSALASPLLEVSALVTDPPGLALRPGMHVALRCLGCSDPAAQTAGTVRRVSNAAPPPGRLSSNLTREITVAFSPEISISPLQRQLLQPGTEVELAITIGRLRALLWSFEPSQRRRKP
jgi:hypothetical protein